MKLGTLAIRGVVGPLMFGHGAQKLFGWFGGHGLEGTAGFFEEALGLRPGKRHATAAGGAETLGGLMIALGLMTPVGASMISGSMITAIRKVHGSKGPWNTEGGWEYNAAILAMMVAISESGPGRPSIDSAAFPRMKGTGWALLQLAAGAAGSWLTTEKLVEEAPPAPQHTRVEGGEGNGARFGREPQASPADTVPSGS
jgi:putative oxidoreductase